MNQKKRRLLVILCPGRGRKANCLGHPQHMTSSMTKLLVTSMNQIQTTRKKTQTCLFIVATLLHENLEKQFAPKYGDRAFPVKRQQIKSTFINKKVPEQSLKTQLFKTKPQEIGFHNQIA